MSLTIATQPSVATAPSSTRGAAPDPTAAGSFGAALTAAVATERRSGDGAPGRDETDGPTPDGSTTTPSTTGTASATDQSAPATEAAPVDAQVLLAAGLVAVAPPTATAASVSSDTGDQPTVRAAERSADDPHAVDAAAAPTAGTATPSMDGETSPQVPSASARTTDPAAAAPPQVPSSGTAAAPTTAAPVAAAATPIAAVVPAPGAATAAGTTPATSAAATAPSTTAPTAVPASAAPVPAPVPSASRSADDGTATTTPAQSPVISAATAAAGSGPRTGHGTDQQASTPGDPGLPAAAPARGGETPFVVSTSSTTAPAAATVPAPAPLAQQLARPVFSLAQAGPGEHVVTVQVVPDSLGPVTVRAHVTAHGMHVELFAASDAGREAVRQVLPDLRRDAAGTGVSTTLDLSSQNQPQDAPGRDERPAARALTGDPGLEARVTPRTRPTTHTPSVRTAGLDVLA